MDNWDIVILVVAGYAAVMSLVRLMAHRRDRLVEEFREQMETEAQRKKAASTRQDRQGRPKVA